eukprot:g3861.t1
MFVGIEMKGFTKDEIMDCIKSSVKEFDGESLNKLQLLSIAKHFGVMSNDLIKASTPWAYRVYKCYLWTVLTNQDFRDKLEEYVMAYSLLWTRAHYIINLWLYRMANIPLKRRQDIDFNDLKWKPREEGEVPRSSTTIYGKLFSTFRRYNPLLYQAFLYEKFPTYSTPLDEDIKQIMLEYGEDLLHLFPKEWENIMSKTGWDSAISFATTSMRTNILLYLRKSIVRCSKEYVKALQEDVDPKILFELLNKPWPKELPVEVKIEVINQIKALRRVIGFDDESYLPKFATEITEDVLDLHLHFCKIGIMKRPLLPIFPLGRKYAYLDSRVAKELFNIKRIHQELTDDNILNFLGFSLQAFRQVQTNKRKRLRRETRKSKKCHHKWKKKGKVSIPHDGVVKSIMTDGVGLVMKYSTPMKIPRFRDFERKPKKRKFDKDIQQTKCEKMRNEDGDCVPTFVGVDLGRCKLYCASIKHEEDQNPFTKTYTRNKYYWAIGHEKRMKEERKKTLEDPNYKMAKEELGKIGQEHNLLSYIRIQSQFASTLLKKTIQSKFYSFSKMRSFRLKKSSLARAANDLIDSATKNGRRVVIGIGNASFPSTGRGEKSIPVKGIIKALHSVKSSQWMKSKSTNISFLTIDEFKTTLVCNCCGHNTFVPWVIKPNGEFRKSSRLRMCITCDPINGKFRDRDVQASRNILELTYLEYYGYPRPPEMSRQKKK